MLYFIQCATKNQMVQRVPLFVLIHVCERYEHVQFSHDIHAIFRITIDYIKHCKVF